MFSVSRRPSLGLDSPYRREQCLKENTEEYLRRLMDGDESAIEPVVLGHSRLAMKIAGSYVRQGIEDELPSIAIVAMVEACHKIIDGRHDARGNLTGYLSSVAHSKCYKAFCEDRLFYTPRPSTKTVPVEAFNSEEKLQRQKSPCSRKVRELKDAILSCCKTDRERQYVSMRRCGFNNVDIGLVFGVSNKQVSKIIKRIERRFERVIVDEED